jgi:hypothetical protein
MEAKRFTQVLNRRCRRAAKTALILLGSDPAADKLTYGVACRVAGRLDMVLFLKGCPEGLGPDTWNKNQNYLGIVTARSFLMTAIGDLIRKKKLSSTKDSELEFDLAKASLRLEDSFQEVLVNLKEVAGLQKSELAAREKKGWIQHWRSLWKFNRLAESEGGSPNPNNTATDDRILQAAKSMYPDMDLEEIRGP